MPKIGMEPIRRQQLIDATIVSIDEVGLADSTIIQISRRAGVSAGIISHYFGGKNGLLEATMRYILTDLGRAVIRRRQALEDDSARSHLYAMVAGNFDRSQVNRAVMKTWLAFWTTSMHRSDLHRLQRVNDRRLYSNLSFQFRKELDVERARDAARGLAALIDGLWLRGALVPQSFDVDRAVAIACRYVDEQLGR